LTILRTIGLTGAADQLICGGNVQRPRLPVPLCQTTKRVTSIEVELSITPNPYQSPATVDPPETWWSRLRKMLRSAPHVRKIDFASGDAIICDGIAYYINPNDTFLAYAASPSSDFSDKRMNLIVTEAIRVLPYFLADYPDLHTQLRGRKLCVRMISEYADVRSNFRREHVLEWDLIDAVLSDGPTESPDDLA